MMRGWEFFLTAPYEGVSYISSVLHNAGYPTRIVDVRFVAEPMEEALRGVLEGTDVLGMATFEDNFPFVRELMRRVKRAAPSIPIITGGSLVTSVPHLFMEHTLTDVAVISEGELTILELMESFAAERWSEDLHRIHGIVYRDEGGEARRTTPRGQMQTLDCLPRMRLDLWPQARGPLGLQPQVITSYSRGCKMDCSFCYRTTPQVAIKSMEKFDSDLRWLKERYNTEFTFFTDLTFSADVRQTLEVCDVLKDHDLRWTAMCRCVDADKVRLDAMYGCGCDTTICGVESLGADALREARKPTTENISLRAMRRTHEAGIRFGALLIIGLPGETLEDLEHMAAWAEEYRHVCRVKYLGALPGTQIYRDGLASGIIRSGLDHVNWLSIEQALGEDEFLNLNRLPEEELRAIHRRIYQCYQPGPVMDFNHFPEHFQYHHPIADDGSQRSVDYAGEGWRSRFSIAGAPLVAGSERYTLDKVGAPGMAEIGAAATTCGAKKMESEQQP